MATKVLIDMTAHLNRMREIVDQRLSARDTLGVKVKKVSCKLSGAIVKITTPSEQLAAHEGSAKE